MRVTLTSHVLFVLLLGCLAASAGFSADHKTRVASHGQDAPLVLDVVFDAKTLSYSRADALGSGVSRGYTFIISGRIYPGGTVPDGDTTFAFPANKPQNAPMLGTPPGILVKN